MPRYTAASQPTTRRTSGWVGDWQVLTSSRCPVLHGETLASAKAYVEVHAPLKRGWTGAWQCIKEGDWAYRRYNSKGTLQANCTVRLMAI